MATAKKTGIVDRVKKAITGVFSDDTKRKPPGRTTAKKAAKNTAQKAATAAKKAAKKTAQKAKTAVKKVTETVAAPARKAAKSAKKVVANKAPAKRSSAAKKAGASRDRKLIALSEPYEVRDWCKSLGCTEDQLRAAVAAVGNSAEKVRAHLGTRKVSDIGG